MQRLACRAADDGMSPGAPAARATSLPSGNAAFDAALRDIGLQWVDDIRRGSEQVKQLYAPLLAAAPRGDVTVLRDVAYGDHPRRRLDLFRPAVPRADGAVVLFVHGGAFVRGDMRATDEIYDNVLFWFARQGYLGCNVEYRLAPEAHYPAGADDIAAAIAWVVQHAGALGGNAAKIHLIGHSAGGTHVASYAFDPALGHGGRHLAAIVLVSARLRADNAPENPNAEGVQAYFGNPANFEVRSPVNHVAASALPLMIAIAEYENPLLDVYGIELAYRVAQARRRAPRFIQMQGHNHMSIVAHFNSGEEMLGRAIVDFFATLD